MYVRLRLASWQHAQLEGELALAATVDSCGLRYAASEPGDVAPPSAQESRTGEGSMGSKLVESEPWKPMSRRRDVRFSPSPPPQPGHQKYTGVDLIRCGAAGGVTGVIHGQQLATVVVDELRSSVDSEEGSTITVMVEDEEQDQVTVYKKHVLLVDVSSSSEDDTDDEAEEDGWMISPKLPGVAKHERAEPPHPKEHSLTPIRSWPGSLMDLWSTPGNQSMQQAGAAAVA